MSAGSPTVCVIIVAFNSGAWLEKCVDALIRQSWRDFECIIVDNASTDGAVDALGSLPENFRVIRSDSNLGFAGGNNRAASDTSAPWIATLNPDAFPEPDWLSQLIAATNRYPDADMFGSTQLLARGVGPRLIIANECLHGEVAPHCQDTTPVFDTIARAESMRDRIGGFGRASAG